MPEDARNPFLLILERYAAAVRAKDVVAYAALYDEDVHVFDMWAEWSSHGIAAWRAQAVEWFTSLGSEYVVVRIDEPSTSMGGELAIGHAILTYTAFSAEGRQLRWLSNRITLALRARDETWTIVHQHTSSPIDHPSLKAMLQYSP